MDQSVAICHIILYTLFIKYIIMYIRINFGYIMLSTNYKKALYECFCSMKQSNSNHDLGIGNGKNINIVKLSNAVIIRNGTNDNIAYRFKDNDTIHYMNGRVMVLEEIPMHFFAVRLLSKPLDDFNYDDTDVVYDKVLVHLDHHAMFFVNANIVDINFNRPEFINIGSNDNYLFKHQIDKVILENYKIVQNGSSLQFILYHPNKVDIIHSYTNYFSCYDESTKTVYTNSVDRLLQSIKSAINYVEKHADRDAIQKNKFLRKFAITAFNDQLVTMSNYEIEAVIEKLKG